MSLLSVDVLRARAGQAGDNTAYAIAQRIGVRESTIFRLLKGKATPSVATLVAVRHAYGISLDELVPTGNGR